MVGVYIIYNSVNEKMYVGSSAKVNFRIGRHIEELKNLRHHSILLQRDFNQYGLSVFKFYLAKAVKHKEDLIKWEQYYIDYYNPEYNICPEAFSVLGRKSTLETRAKISKALKGRVSPLKGTKFTKIHRLRISRSLTGIKRSKETRKKIVEAWKIRKTYPISEETRRKLSAVWKGRKQTMQHKQRRMEALKKTLALKKEERLRGGR